MKISSYTDTNGHIKKVLLPDDVPDTDARLGIPLGLNLAGLYPEPFASQLEDALIARNLNMPEDFEVDGIHTLVRQAIQQILRIDTHDVIEYVRKQK